MSYLDEMKFTFALKSALPEIAEFLMTARLLSSVYATVENKVAGDSKIKIEYVIRRLQDLNEAESRMLSALERHGIPRREFQEKMLALIPAEKKGGQHGG